MLIAAGLIIVFAAVLAGFLLENGQPLVLLQPAELIIIGGAAFGAILISNPSRTLLRLLSALASLRRPAAHSSAFYLELLKLLYALFSFAQRQGVPALESHIEKPFDSPIFERYPVLLTQPDALNFLCDSVRMATSAGLGEQDLDALMSLDIEVQRAGKQQPVSSLMNVADSLPGLGIVAAVLGVVVTMQALGGPASEIGHKVAAALVGTFLGILLCYGVVGPLATRLQLANRASLELLHVLRAGVVTFIGGASPLVAAEFARRAIAVELRPSFDLMETELRRSRSVPANQSEPLQTA